MAGSLQPIVFELLLDGKEVPDDHISTGYVFEGDPFIVRCVANDDYTGETSIRKRNEPDVEMKEYKDESFNYQSDSGLYECSALHGPTQILHERRIHLSSRFVSLKGKQCSKSDSELCKGICAVVNEKSICHCPIGTVGIHCEENLVINYVDSTSYISNLRYTVQVAAGTGGGFLISVCIVASILALLFFREKRKTSRFVSLYGPLPEVNAYGDVILPENPYKKISTTHSLPDRTDSLRNAFRFPKARPRPDLVPTEDQRSHLPLVDPSKLEHIPSIS